MKNSTSLLEEHENFFRQKAILDDFLLIDSPDEYKLSLEEIYFFWLENSPDICQENRKTTTMHFRALSTLLQALSSTIK
ncbi:MAG: hypothetical protein VYB44_07225 [Bacteroidota bacterium]|nr:hypothetical protein [Bacteroidota bacterium]